MILLLVYILYSIHFVSLFDVENLRSSSKKQMEMYTYTYMFLYIHMFTYIYIYTYLCMHTYITYPHHHPTFFPCFNPPHKSSFLRKIGFIFRWHRLQRLLVKKWWPLYLEDFLYAIHKHPIKHGPPMVFSWTRSGRWHQPGARFGSNAAAVVGILELSSKWGNMLPQEPVMKLRWSCGNARCHGCHFVKIAV